MNKSIFIAATVLALMAVETQAQGGMGGGQGDRGQRPEFSEIDADGDGLVSVEEMAVLNSEDRPDRATTMMSRMDSDEDGSLNEEEWNTRPQRQGGGGMGGN